MITILVVLGKTNKLLGYGYYHVFHGYMSELLGNDNYGTELTDYVYSNICGGRCTKDGFSFNGNPYFYIRTSCENVWGNFLKNIKNKKCIFDGFNVIGFNVIDTPLNKKYYETDASTPILVSKKYNFCDNLSSEDIFSTEKYLVNSVTKKANDSGFEIDPNLSIKIVMQRNHRDINYRGVINKGRNFKMKIDCNDSTKEFILTHGLGRSTSCGFGFLI
jgi:CRISPR-associated endoribonuclease Cas6